MVLTAALIGLGNIAWRYDRGNKTADGSCVTHLSTLSAHPDVEVIGGFDPDPDVRTSWTSDSKMAAWESLDALLASEPDIVSICSPSSMHARHVEECLEAGIPMIWLEKPATTSLADTDRLLDLQSKKATSTVLVGFQRRYLPIYQRLKDQIQAHKSVQGVTVTYSRGLETNGSHLIDLLFFLFGENRNWEIKGCASSGNTQHGHEESPSFLIEFEGGPICNVVGLDLPYHNIDIALYFDDGCASVVHGGLEAHWDQCIENELFPGFFRTRREKNDPTESLSAIDELRNVFPVMLADLIDASQQKRPPVSNLASARSGQALVEAVLKMEQ